MNAVFNPDGLCQGAQIILGLSLADQNQTRILALSDLAERALKMLA